MELPISGLEVLDEIANDAARDSLLAGIDDTSSDAGSVGNEDVGVREARRRLVFESGDEVANSDDGEESLPSSDNESVEGIDSPDPSDVSSLSDISYLEEDEEEAEYDSTFTGLPPPNPDTIREHRFV